METKRLLLAFALSAAVLIGWTVLFPPPKSSGPAARPAVSAPAATTAPATAPSATASTPAPSTTAPAPPGPGARRERDSCGRGRRGAVEVRSPLYTARLSNQGGALSYSS